MTTFDFDTRVIVADLVAVNSPNPPMGWWELVDLGEAWYDQPDIDQETPSIPGAHGSLPPENPTYQARYPEVHLRKRLAPDEDVRQVQWPEFSRIRLGVAYPFTVIDRFGQLTAQVWLAERPRFRIDTVAWWVDVVLSFVAPDPRKYGVADPIVVPAAPSVVDGLRFPMFETGGLDFGSFATAGDFGQTEFGLWNGGSIESWPVFSIRGPVQTGFSIVTEGGELRYEDSVGGGETLVLSPYAGGRAVLDGVDVTTNLTVADWVPVASLERRAFTFVPVGVVGGGAQIDIDFREAWI